jgi:methanogenic corrinoid protein MtbC1
MSTLLRQISQHIDQRKNSLAHAIINQHYAQAPDLKNRHGEHEYEKYFQDANYHLTYLSEAFAAKHPSLFANYIGWAKVLLTGIGIPMEELVTTLSIMKQVLKQELPVEAHELIDQYLEHGLSQLPTLPTQLPTVIDEQQPLANLAKQYLEMLLRGERHLASRLILAAVEEGTAVKDIYLHVFQQTQYEIGRRWQMNQVTVAQEHYCTAATQLIMSQLYPYIFATTRKNYALIATCIGGELHEIGVRMVTDFFEMAGWDTYYLGANVPASTIVETIEQRKADILAISATMTFHVHQVEKLIQTIRSHENFQVTKIMVGGYPFNLEPELWKQVGADAYANNAQEAIDTAEKLLI